MYLRSHRTGNCILHLASPMSYVRLKHSCPTSLAIFTVNRQTDTFSFTAKHSSGTQSAPTRAGVSCRPAQTGLQLDKVIAHNKQALGERPWDIKCACRPNLGITKKQAKQPFHHRTHKSKKTRPTDPLTFTKTKLITKTMTTTKQRQ